MNKAIAWVKQNKAVAGVVAIGAFLFMAKKGDGGGGGGSEAVDPALDDGGGTRVVGVPYSAEAGDFDNDAAMIDRDDYKEGIDAGLDLAKEVYEQELENEETAGDEDTPLPVKDKQGITLHGKFFRGATGYTLSRTDAQGFMEYLIKYDGHAERWQYNSGTNEWMQSWKNPTARKQPPEKQPQKGNPAKNTNKKPKDADKFPKTNKPQEAPKKDVAKKPNVTKAKPNQVEKVKPSPKQPLRDQFENRIEAGKSGKGFLEKHPGFAATKIPDRIVAKAEPVKSGGKKR